MDRVLTRWCAKRPTRDIRINDRPYLLRVYVAHWGGWRVYLHRFISSDGDRFLHDHPFCGAALVLSGSYLEERMGVLDLPSPVVRVRRVRWLNILPARVFHRIACVRPGTWTLFINAPHFKRWGFLFPRRDADGIALVYANPHDQSINGAGAQWWAASNARSFVDVVADYEG